MEGTRTVAALFSVDPPAPLDIASGRQGMPILNDAGSLRRAALEALFALAIVIVGQDIDATP